MAGVASDGTHIPANANRFECWTQAKIADALPKLMAEFALRLEEHSASETRERRALKMTDPANQKNDDQRMRITETPFALIKQVLGLQQFLLRGLDKLDGDGPLRKGRNVP